MKKIIIFLLIILVVFSNFNFIGVFASEDDTIGLISGEYYYIKNLATSKCLDVFNAENTDGTGVCTYPTNRSGAQNWELQRISGQYYRLITAVSREGRSLTTNSSGWSFIQTYSGSSYQKFYIERVDQNNGAIDSSNIDGTYTIRYGNKYLAVDSGGSYLEWTTNNSNRAKWVFQCSYQQYVFCYAMNTNIDTRDGTLSFKNRCTRMEYYARMYTNSSDFNGACDNLAIADIFLNYQHGFGAGAVSGFYVDSGSRIGFWVSYPGIITGTQKAISSYDDNELARARLVIWWSCRAGLTVNNINRLNLVDSTYEKGAHFVIAPTIDFYTPEGDDWLSYFSAKLNACSTIYEAISYANSKEPYFRNNLYFRGDGNQDIYIYY